ncbi:ferredoxin [Kitasatospora sp. NPDC057500]|uniref:ferredoxin n=1 Tax=Kitasatospora sp. NPDC057500 TaxID=3346151 RepID=UPI0036C17672
MEVHADRTRCIGAGMCALTVPEVFDQDEDDGLVTLLDPHPPRATHPAVRLAIATCPAGALTSA